MNRPRLIATDLDGTLVTESETISDRNARALARAADAGCRVVLVTGRPARWLPQIYQQLHAAYPAICGNGAAVYDPVTATVLDTSPLPAEVLVEVCTQLRALVPGIAFAVEIDGGRSMLHEQEYELRWDLGDPAVRVVGSAELVAYPAIKLLARA